MTEKQFKILNDIFILEDVKYNYSIGSFADNCMCLEKEDNTYVVYDVINGEKKRVIKYTTINDACEGMIIRIADSQKQEEQMLNRLWKMI